MQYTPRDLEHPTQFRHISYHKSLERFIILTQSLQQHKHILEATPEERIAQLEAARAELVRKKNEMERKMALVAERRRERELEQAKEMEQSKER